VGSAIHYTCLRQPDGIGFLKAGHNASLSHGSVGQLDADPIANRSRVKVIGSTHESERDRGCGRKAIPEYYYCTIAPQRGAMAVNHNEQ
jgi:hypothetical protein